MDVYKNLDITAGVDWPCLFRQGRTDSYLRAPAESRTINEPLTEIKITSRTQSRTQAAETLQALAIREMSATGQEIDPVLEKTRDDRIAMLAMKYAGIEQNSEHSARIKILTARLRKLTPRVTDQDWEVFENIAVEITNEGEELAALEAEYGL